MNTNNATTRLDAKPLETRSVARFSGIEASVLLGARDTSTFTVLQMTVQQGLGSPEHISPMEDKVFQVTEGEFLFLVDGSRFTATPGACIYIAKGARHSFCATSDDGARMTLVSYPAHHERFFEALAALPTPHDPREVAQVCADFSQEIVGPIVQRHGDSGNGGEL